MPGGMDDGFNNGVSEKISETQPSMLAGAVGTIEVPPGMAEKIAAVRASDEACGIANIPVTDEVARDLEGGKLAKK